MKKLGLALVLLCTLNMSIAQEGDTTPKLSPHHIGLHAGSTTGTGFSYRYWPTRWGVQVTGIPIFQQGSSFTSIGVSALFLLKDNDRVDLFSYLGNHTIITTNKGLNWDPNTGLYVEDVSTTVIDNIGLGLGMRVTIFDVVNLNFQAGYGVYEITTTPNTFLAGEIGLYYQL